MTEDTTDAAPENRPFTYDDIVLKNDDESAGAAIAKDSYMDGIEGSKISLDNMESMIAVARELGWDSLWVSTGGDCEPVFIEPADDHGMGALTIAPIFPVDDDEEGDDE